MNSVKYITSMVDDGSVWGIPVSIVARNRAEYFASRDYGGDVERSLREDTLPLFEAYEHEAIDWVLNNMHVHEIGDHLVKLRHGDSPPSLAEQWVSDRSNFITEVFDI